MWRYQIKKYPYSWDDAAYLTMNSLNVAPSTWHSIGNYQLNTPPENDENLFYIPEVSVVMIFSGCTGFLLNYGYYISCQFEFWVGSLLLVQSLVHVKPFIFKFGVLGLLI